MRLIDTITVTFGQTNRRIELLQGDLTAIPSEHGVDLLVVSAFPDDYISTSTSLIGALDRKGLSVEDLAASKYVDMRSTCSCWLSHELRSLRPGLRFKWILCFEPADRGRPPELVGDIFRALTPFVGGKPPIRSIAMPLVTVGDQAYPVSAILPPLIDAAYHWLAIGLPVDTIKIVSYSDRSSAEAASVFADAKANCAPATIDSTTKAKYDVFVSYSHKDRSAGASINAQLTKRNLRTFFDKQSLDLGVAWQQKIFEALDSCSRMVAVYSPDYVQSKVCQEEFNIAWARGRNKSITVILPIYWRSTELPTYMTMLNYIDCREQNKTQLHQACREIALALPKVGTSHSGRGIKSKHLGG